MSICPARKTGWSRMRKKEGARMDARSKSMESDEKDRRGRKSQNGLDRTQQDKIGQEAQVMEDMK